jgi:hypothetical protein
MMAAMVRLGRGSMARVANSPSAPAQVLHAVGRGAVLVLCVCALLIVAGVLSPAAHAQAQQVPQVVEDNLDSATQFYAKESGVAEAPCDAGCSALLRDLERPPTVPKDPMPARIIKSLVDKAVRVGGQVATKIPWKMPDPYYWSATGGLAVALTGANIYVWKVRVLDPIRRAYFIEAPKSLIDNRPAGLTLQFADGTDGGFYIHGPDGTLPDPLPIGIVARNTTLSRAQTGGCASPCLGEYCGDANWAGMPKPAEMVEYSWIASYDCDGGVAYLYHGWRVPIEQSLGFINGLDSYDSPNSPVTFDVHGTLMTLQELKDRLQGVLTSDDPEYSDVGPWMCAVFGGECQNPKDAYPTTPDCVGETATACTQAFRDAGFIGDITVTTLDTDQVVMEQQAGEVTDTYPHSEIQIAAPRDITIYANPDPMPTMTADDEALADTLEDQNPDVVNQTNKKTLARTCRVDMADAGRAASECAALPIMVAGNDQVTPAWNGLGGIARNPSWAVLNRRDIRDLSRNAWYFNLPGPGQGCAEDDPRKVMTSSCDESPFWSTMQGYGGTLNTMTPNISWAPQAEQDRQAAIIRQFYSNNNPGTKIGFHGCDITRQPPTDVLPIRASTFVFLPLPFSRAIPSTGICNKLLTP